MGSNRRFIDKKRLQTKKGQEKISIIPCGTAEHAVNIATDPHFEEPKVILICTETNDIEKGDPKSVHDNFAKTASTLADKFPSSHIAVSGVVRNDNDDIKCRELNELFEQTSQSDGYFEYLPVENLSDSKMFYDKKYFKRGYGVTRLAIHLKTLTMSGLGYKTSRTQNTFSPGRGDRTRGRGMNNQWTFSKALGGMTVDPPITGPGIQD